MLKLLTPERMMNKRNVIDDLKNHEIDSWSKKKQWKKAKEVEEANSPLNQKARVKRIQGFEHQWIGGPKEVNPGLSG